ncbi:hypothetical protein D6855_16385 [Butyrivibrio sp. CB08]|nr:hypothetical protein D6855_16385 [Butyrivibrio sp. CB08]
MSAIKDGRYEIELNGKKYHMLFSLNALDEIQDKFGGYDKLDVAMSEGKDMIKNIRWLFTLLLNEGRADEEPELTEQQVGKLIHVGNLNQIKGSIINAFAYGATGGEETTDEAGASEGNEGNMTSAQEN